MLLAAHRAEERHSSFRNSRPTPSSPSDSLVKRNQLRKGQQGSHKWPVNAQHPPSALAGWEQRGQTTGWKGFLVERDIEGGDTPLLVSNIIWRDEQWKGTTEVSEGGLQLLHHSS